MDDGTRGDDETPNDGESNQIRFARYFDELVRQYCDSQAGLAKVIGVKEQTISAWRRSEEGGHVPANQILARKAAQALEQRITKVGDQFDREKFMALWAAADRERRSRQGAKPPKQPPEIGSSLEPDSVHPVKDANTEVGRPDVDEPEPDSTAGREAHAPQSVGVPPAPDTSAHTHRRRGLLIPLLGVVAVVASLLYFAVQWVSSQQPGGPTYPNTSGQIGTTSPIPQVSTIYRTDADPAKGAHVHEFPPGSSVDQQFRATAPKIVRVAAIIGSDAAPNRARIGRVRFELLDCTAAPVRRDLDAFNNIDTLATLDPAVSVNQGQMCTLRVTNLERARTLGFYFNRNPNLENQTVLHGAVDPPGASAPHEHGLSGHILGQGP